MKKRSLIFFLLMALGATGAMYAQTSLPWSEDFENYSSTTLGSEWATPATYGGKPCVLRGNSWASPAGSNSLECRTNSSNSNVFVFPQFNKPLNTLTVQFKIGGHTSGRGQFGYVTNASSASSFVKITDIAQPSTVGSGSNGYTQYNYDLSTMSAPTSSTYRLAVKYTFVGSDEDSWYFDDFSVTYTEPSGGGDGDETCEDFESVTGTAYNSAGSMPSGWYSYTTATGNNIVAPHVTSGTSYNFYNSGSQSVNMESGTNATSSTGNYAYVVLPLYNNVTQLKYWSKRESTTYGVLKLGYVDAQTSTACNNFTTLATVTPNTTNTEYTIDFENNYTLPAGKYIAFQWNTNGSYYACCIDDVCVTTAAGTAPASLPYTENFENGQNGWEFGNGTQTNYWMVGSNTSYNSSNSLYITNNGSAYAYSTGNTSFVYAYRMLNIPSAGDYVVSFKWKANGESTYDLLRAFMIPVSVNPTLTGGTNNGQSGSSNTTPTGWIDVANPSGKLNLQSAWQSSEKNVNLSTAGVYYLVFFWKNDSSGGSTPPAAVDDIDVHEAATYNVTVSANGSGTVSGGGNNIAEGTSVTVTATPNVGYNFVNWTENGTEVSTNPSYTFTLEGDRNLVANFEAWTLNVATNPSSTVGLTYGTQVTMTASTNIPTYNNYTFTQTTETFSSISGSPDGTSTSTGDGADFAFQLPFAFNLAGKDFAQGTTLTMRCDGYVSLGTPVYSSHTPSSPGSTYTMIAPFGYDQQLESTSKMYYKTTTENGAQVLIMEWNNMRSYSNSNSTYNWANYQVKLYEGSNIVKFCYGSFTYNVSKTMYSYITADGRMTQLTSSYASPVVVTNTTGSTPSGIDVNSASTAPANGTVYTFAPFTYTWTANGTQGTANGDTYTVTPTENSSYTVSLSIYGQTYSETVEVTMQALTKIIEAVGNENWEAEKGGYYLIASPLAAATAPTDVDGMITDELGTNVDPTTSTYDLYSFNQAQELEWQNYRASNNFNLVNGTGYLYASKGGTTLTFSGAPYSGDTKTVTLSVAENTDNLGAVNLVGNPFAQDAYITKSFYTLENSDTYTSNTAGTPIHAMQGLLVVADEDGETMTFSTEAPAVNNSKLNMNVSNERSVVDQAIISFTEGQQLPKLQFRNGSTKVYIPQDGKDYAIVSAESMGTMPVNFKAENNGTYTLNFNAEEVSFSYLHLIDNMTGIETDLLANPSYSFDAKTTDYESRFKLVFATGNNANDDAFAFYSNGSFVINNEGNATLQVIDVNGRILKSESINGCTNVNVKAAAGVYMLRLVNGNDVKVQKVVVR